MAFLTSSEAQMQTGEIHQHGPQQLAIQEYKSPQTTQSMAIVSYNSSPSMCQTHSSDHKLRSDLSMVDNFCPPPSGFMEAPPDPGPIDTFDVARRVRDILERHKISQTLFSKYVIRRSQGTTSDLLRSPKQWDRMSEEGRTPYRRMKAWLEGDLAHNVQMLVQIKQGHDVLPASYFAPKGLRTKFTDEQRDALEEFFSQNPRLTHDTLEAFASEHNLTISAVRNWVNNRKQRLKRNYGSSFEGNDPKIPKVDKETNFNEQSTQRGSNGQIDSLKVNVGNFKQIDKDKGEDSPVASPTMVNGPRFKQGDNNGMDTKKSAQGNGLLSDIFDGSTGIPTMVDNVSMDCLGTAAE